MRKLEFLNLLYMLELKNVAVSHNGKQLFEGLSFVARNDEVTAISGPSGCGKTTLLKVLLGLHPADEGYVSIDGELITALSAPTFRQMFAYMPQDISFAVDTVKELVELPFTLKTNCGQNFSKEKVMEQWRMLALDPSLYDKRTCEISGGERQRIMIANLGLLNKRIVLADEPTSALDQLSATLVGDYLKRLASQGAVVIVVSHRAITTTS